MSGTVSGPIINQHLYDEDAWFSSFIHINEGNGHFIEQNGWTYSSPYGDFSITEHDVNVFSAQHDILQETYTVTQGADTFTYSEHFTYANGGFNEVETTKINGQPGPTYHYDYHPSSNA